MEVKFWFTDAKGCDKMIFKGLYDVLCGIGVVQVGRDELKISAFLAHEGFEGCWALIVHNLEGWVETALSKFGVQSRVCAYEFVLP